MKATPFLCFEDNKFKIGNFIKILDIFSIYSTKKLNNLVQSVFFKATIAYWKACKNISTVPDTTLKFTFLKNLFEINKVFIQKGFMLLEGKILLFSQL